MPQRGFTLFEFAVAVILLALFMLVQARHLLSVRASGEQAEVSWVLAALRTTLDGRAHVLRIEGRADRIAELAGSNPMEWLDPKPPNYRGEYYRPEPGMVAPGSWYFDRATKCLIYVPNFADTFAQKQVNMLKFKVEFSRLLVPAGTEAAGIALNQVEVQ